MSDEIVVQFQGFTPSQFTRMFVGQMLERIQDEAPASASLRATISKSGSEFRGVLRVTSTEGEFTAVARSEHLPDVGSKLHEQIRRQLDRWKARRFKHENPRKVRSFRRENDRSGEADGIPGA